MFDWLDTVGLNDVDSVDDGDILWLRFDMIVWAAGKYKNKVSIRISTKRKKTLHCWNYFMRRWQIYA